MSDEEYTQEPEIAFRGFKMDAFIPMVLTSVTLIVMLSWQVVVTSNQKTLFENAITRQEPQVNQSNQVQAGLQKLAEDLLDAAQTDPTAKAIADKYIHSNGGAGGVGGAAAPAPTP
jgi:hypothetical protein